MLASSTGLNWGSKTLSQQYLCGLYFWLSHIPWLYVGFRSSTRLASGVPSSLSCVLQLLAALPAMGLAHHIFWHQWPSQIQTHAHTHALPIRCPSMCLWFLLNPADPTVPNVTVTRLSLVCDSAPGPITMDLTGEWTRLYCLEGSKMSQGKLGLFPTGEN